MTEHDFTTHPIKQAIMLIRLTHADTSARTIGIPEQSRSAPLEG